MGKAILYIVTIAILYLIVCAAWPYWNKYRLTSDMEAAALYGTKHDIEKTQEIFTQKAKDRGYDIDPEKFHIEKDENKTVSIKWTYHDKISFFSIILKKFEFTIEVTKRETEERF
jgi:hypothetical protein